MALRTSGRLAGPLGLLPGLGKPDHSVLSLSCRRSLLTRPKTIAPVLPLPKGRASSHTFAGRSYQSFSSGSVLEFWAETLVRPRQQRINKKVYFIGGGLTGYVIA